VKKGRCCGVNVRRRKEGESDDGKESLQDLLLKLRQFAVTIARRSRGENNERTFECEGMAGCYVGKRSTWLGYILRTRNIEEAADVRGGWEPERPLQGLHFPERAKITPFASPSQVVALSGGYFEYLRLGSLLRVNV
jgi:hypothetical protein